MRVSTAEKTKIILGELSKGSRSLAQLADALVKRLGMRYSTARPAVTRIINRLVETGIVREAGTDKRGSRIVELTRKGHLTFGLAQFLEEAIKNIQTAQTTLDSSPSQALPYIEKAIEALQKASQTIRQYTKT